MGVDVDFSVHFPKFTWGNAVLGLKAAAKISDIIESRFKGYFIYIHCTVQ